MKGFKADNIADPLEWNQGGRPIRFINRNVHYDINFYNVYRCDYCGKYSTDLVRHKERHCAGMQPTPMPRGLIYPQVRLRPRRELLQELNRAEPLDEPSDED